MELPVSLSPPIRAYCQEFTSEEALLDGLQERPDYLYEFAIAALSQDWQATHPALAEELIQKLEMVGNLSCEKATEISQKAASILGKRNPIRSN